MIQTIRTVVQDSKGRAVALTLERPTPPAPSSLPSTPGGRSASLSIGINSRKEMEKNLIASPQYFWQHYDEICWPTGSLGLGSTSVGLEHIDTTDGAITGDIGYDPCAGTTIVGILSGGIEGGAQVKLFQLSSITDTKRDVCAAGGSTCCALLSRHTISSPIGGSPTLQLWKVSPPLSTSHSPAFGVPASLTRSVCVSVVSQSSPPSSSTAAQDKENVMIGLQPCCSVVTIRMSYGGSQSGAGHSTCTESTISVVSSTLAPSPSSCPPAASSPSLTANSTTSSNMSTALFNAKFGRHSHTSEGVQPESVAEIEEGYRGSRFQLLNSPVLTEGALFTCVHHIYHRSFRARRSYLDFYVLLHASHHLHTSYPSLTVSFRWRAAPLPTAE